MTPNALDRLVALFSKLPGVGKKSAGRMAYHILDGDPAYARALAGELAGLHQAIRRCGVCGGFTETDPCPICSDPGRDHSIICVIERAQDLRVIEESREFHGVFHVLGGLIAPLEGVGPGNLSIGKLIARLRGEAAAPGGVCRDENGGRAVKELILALNPTVEGDTTALYLQKLLKDFPVEVTRLASGLPVGGDLEYTDRLTLSRSFRGRVKV
jgi:recombination protein RecR